MQDVYVTTPYIYIYIVYSVTENTNKVEFFSVAGVHSDYSYTG